MNRTKENVCVNISFLVPFCLLCLVPSCAHPWHLRNISQTMELIGQDTRYGGRESRAITILKFPFADIFTHQEQWQLRLHSISNFTALANWERRVLCSRTCCGSLFTLCFGNSRNKLPCPNGISCNSCHTTYEHSWLATCRRVLYYLWQRISTETTKKWANDWITSSTEY